MDISDFGDFEDRNNNKNSRGRRRTEGNYDEAEENINNYLDIWQTNPSFKDFNLNLANLRTISLISFAMSFVILTYLISLNLIISLSIGFFFLICFVIVFHDNFFGFKNFFFNHFRNVGSVEPFDDLEFYLMRDDSNTLYFTNKKDLISTGLSIFQIKVLPENVRPNLNHFIKSLNEEGIPYSYQVVHTPIFKSKSSLKSIRKEHDVASSESFKVNIYFSIFYNVNGMLTKNKLMELHNALRRYRNKMRTSFIADFHHFRIELLSGVNLLRALKSLVFKVENDTHPEKDSEYRLEIQSPEVKMKFLEKGISGTIIKLAFLSFIFSYLSYTLFLLEIPLTYIIISNLAVFIIILFIWWREVLFYLSKARLYRNNDITLVNPFKNVDFYRFREFPDSLFLHIDKSLLVGLKMSNLQQASPVFTKTKEYENVPDKLFRPLLDLKIPFTYTICISPITYYLFDKKPMNRFLNLMGRSSINNIKTDMKGYNWLAMRNGVWQTMFTFSTTTSLYTDFTRNKISSILQIEDLLKQKIDSIISTFKGNFFGFEFEHLKNQYLLSGYNFEILKNKLFSYEKTHLNYLMFQGKSLILLTYISDQFRRALETRIGAEFNTPLQLENFVNFGNTFNTEFLEEEIPVGLLLEQIHNLLIVNGTSKSREMLTMRLVSELVKVRIPSLVFDFTGNWSKLISYFDGTRYEDEFLHFQLGKTFNIDPVHSELPYDQNNLDYLDYMFDAYAMSFNKDDRNMDIFKNTILNNPELNIVALNVELKNQQEWKRTPVNNAMIALFDEFTQRDAEFFYTAKDDQLSGSITFLDLIKDDRTVIFDLSRTNNFKKQTFIMFTIISKIIHYIKDSDEFEPKIILAPEVDQFFAEYYLDRTKNYGDIDKFLNPLKNDGFGLMFSANQIRHLHSNLFNHFENLISFKTADKRDASALRNRMSLQELQGKGLFGPNRKNTYQIEYLMNMKPGEALVRRSDINQPFPVKINSEEIEQTKLMIYDDIIAYMKRQGYDLKLNERRILEQTEKTLFEKDLGSYSSFLVEVCKFLNALRNVDNISIYKTNIEKQLMKFIYPKVSNTITQDKKEIPKIRDELLSILLTHGYLKESHHKPPGGGPEAMRSSFSVGEQYSLASDDYFAVMGRRPLQNDVEIIEKDPLNGIDFKKILSKYLGEFFSDLYSIYRNIDKEKYEKAIKLEKSYIKNFLIKLYKDLYKVNFEITGKDLNEFASLLITNGKLPFTLDDFKKYIELSGELTLAQAIENYQKLSEFFDKIQDHIGDV